MDSSIAMGCLIMAVSLVLRTNLDVFTVISMAMGMAVVKRSTVVLEIKLQI
jgi:hypothetical protein